MSLTWPNGSRAAAAFTFDVDAESCVLAHDPAASSRMSLMTHQAYGPRVGVPRLLRLLERQGVTATFFVPGFTAFFAGILATWLCMYGLVPALQGPVAVAMGGVDLSWLAGGLTSALVYALLGPAVATRYRGASAPADVRTAPGAPAPRVAPAADASDAPEVIA